MIDHEDRITILEKELEKLQYIVSKMEIVRKDSIWQCIKRRILG